MQNRKQKREMGSMELDELFEVELPEKEREIGTKRILTFDRDTEITIDGKRMTLLEGFNEYIVKACKTNSNKIIAIKLVAVCKRIVEAREKQGKPKK